MIIRIQSLLSQVLNPNPKEVCNVSFYTFKVTDDGTVLPLTNSWVWWEEDDWNTECYWKEWGSAGLVSEHPENT
ncbi:MAG: hypothetical protein ACE5OP_10095 [Candidatus Glassbacteria bacterium]